MAAKIVSSSAGEAFHRTIDLLFKPFSLKRWGKFVLIAWLAGSLSGGCHNLAGGNGGRHRAETPPAATTVSTSSSAGAVSKPADPALGKKLETQHEKKYWFEHSLLKSARNSAASIPAWYMNVVVWPLLALLLLLVIAFILFWIWLSAHFKFVWLHAVRTGEIQIRRPFRLYELSADSLATFLCWASLVELLYLFALFALPAWACYRTWLIAPAAFGDMRFLFSAFWPWILLVIFSWIVTALFFSIISDFIVPLMAHDNLYFKEGFRKWLSIYTDNRPAVWRYYAMKFILFVLAGALTMASALLVLIVSVLAAGILFGLLYLVCMVLMKLKMLFWILAAIFGMPFLAAMVIGLSFCALPASLFFRVFSLTFLEKLTLPSDGTQ